MPPVPEFHRCPTDGRWRETIANSLIHDGIFQGVWTLESTITVTTPYAYCPKSRPCCLHVRHTTRRGTDSSTLTIRPEPTLSRIDLTNITTGITYKDNFRGLHGKVTPAAIDRISRSTRNVKAALGAFDKANKVKPKSRGHTPRDHNADVQLLSKCMHEECIFKQISNRYHKSFPGMKNNFMSAIDHPALNKWIRVTFKHDAR